MCNDDLWEEEKVTSSSNFMLAVDVLAIRNVLVESAKSCSIESLCIPPLRGRKTRCCCYRIQEVCVPRFCGLLSIVVPVA